MSPPLEKAHHQQLEHRACLFILEQLTDSQIKIQLALFLLNHMVSPFLGETHCIARMQEVIPAVQDTLCLTHYLYKTIPM